MGFSFEKEALAKPKRIRMLVALLVCFMFIAMLFVVPVALAQPPYFDDVPPGHMFYDQINWIYENGITSGCSVTPPLYCPDAAVSRGQMAVFMYHLAGYGTGGAIVDADTLDGLDSTDFANAGHDHWGESWSGSGIGLTLESTDTTGTNPGVWGISVSVDGNGVYGFATALTGEAWGVTGVSDSVDGAGVAGIATSTTGKPFGVYGESWSVDDHTAGVFGVAAATNGFIFGIRGRTASNHGVGTSGFATSTTGDTIGVYGLVHSSNGVGVYGWANSDACTNYGVYGRSDSPSGYGVYYVGGAAGTGTKSAIVETEDYSWRHLYAVESPGNWFEDFGAGQLVDGSATITIEPIFAQTVNLTEEYHVYVTPSGDCPIFVSEKTATSFNVQAMGGRSCSISFDYRIVAKRMGYEQERLIPADPPASSLGLGAVQGRKPASLAPERMGKDLLPQ
jgi:hypothetical protein